MKIILSASILFASCMLIPVANAESSIVETCPLNTRCGYEVNHNGTRVVDFIGMTNKEKTYTCHFKVTPGGNGDKQVIIRLTNYEGLAGLFFGENQAIDVTVKGKKVRDNKLTLGFGHRTFLNPLTNIEVGCVENP